MTDERMFLLPAMEGGPIKGKMAAPKGWPDTIGTVDLSTLNPGDGLGLCTGGPWDVVDIDVHGGENLDEQIAQVRGKLPPIRRVIRTAGGGLHLYIDALGLRKRTGFLPGIDYQGAGAFVIAPPTEGYVELEQADWPDLGVPDDGTWLKMLLKPVTKERTSISGDISQRHRDKGEAVLRKAERDFADMASPGERNSALRAVALPLVSFVKSGVLDEGNVRRRLLEAAQGVPHYYGDSFTEKEFQNVWDGVWRDAQPQLPELTDPFYAPQGVSRETSLNAHPQIMDIRGLLDPDRPLREWVIDRLLPAGTSVSIVAKAGSKKSLIALRLGLAVARGEGDFAGMRIPTQRKVAYLDFENTEDDLRERLVSFGVTVDDDLTGFMLLLHPQLPPLNTEVGGERLLEWVDELGLSAGDLVILDSYQRITQGSENDADTAQNYYRYAGLPLKERGITVIRLDNTGKDESRGARGSASKRDDVDIEYLLSAKGATVEVSVGKARLRTIDTGGLSIGVHTGAEGRTVFTSDVAKTLDNEIADCIAWLDEQGTPMRGQDSVISWIKENIADGCPFSRDRILRPAITRRLQLHKDFEGE